MYVKEKIDEGLQTVRQQLQRDNRVLGSAKLLSLLRGTATASNSSRGGGGAAANDYMVKALDRGVGTAAQKCVSMLSTGNIISSTGLDLMQVSGFTVVADRLNALRYISHFRAVHRGQFFTTMKTTAVRKLLPESWGFLCPAHTPDGGPCGLLQHLSLLPHVMLILLRISADLFYPLLLARDLLLGVHGVLGQPARQNV